MVSMNNKDIEKLLKDCLNKPMYIRKKANNTGEDVLNLDEQDLLDGEVSAYVFDLGFYKIRSAKRLYLKAERGRIPACEELVKNFRGKNPKYKLPFDNSGFLMFENIRNKIFIVNEISAKSINNNAINEWKKVCSFESRGGWMERIKILATASENLSTDESDDSLVILKERIGISYTTYYWNILNSDGTFKVYDKDAFDNSFKECN